MNTRQQATAEARDGRTSSRPVRRARPGGPSPSARRAVARARGAVAGRGAVVSCGVVALGLIARPLSR
ncbi:hypothetical protein ACWDF1_27835 [Streptomyces coelicoflavus]|uniref:hypothetical protein n=1 Tax=Streptomyces coelicoflavus TaxID=285562 RepID=UPI00331CD989